MTSKTFLRALAAIILPFTLAIAPCAAQAQWAPSKQVTFPIGVAPGGTVDLYARAIKQILEAKDLIAGQNVLAENRPGAAGLFALQLLQRNPGDAHFLTTFHTGFIAGALSGALKADMRDFTPVAIMVEESTLVIVRADSQLKTAQDLVKALKQDPTALRIAVAPALGQNIHLAIAKPLRVAGVDIRKMTVAPFRSSAESMTALLGGHVDVISATTPIVLPHLASGKVRVLATVGKERAGGPLASVPTWREQGVDADYVSYSGVQLAKSVSAEQIRFWEGALRKVAESAEWKQLVEKSGAKPIFLGHAQSQRYLLEEWAATKALLSDLGLSEAGAK